jgi:prepilin-type N-terminal cleavage/methylation domain-containing protein/prepilin-type processing-associated H-X9-DG protein
MWYVSHRMGPRKCRNAFTLIELLVVIAIIAILAALVMPALASAKLSGGKAVCISNLRQIGLAIHNYASDFEGRIPYGPKAPPYTSPANFYPSTGAPTSLLSLQGGSPVALGLLLRHHLASQPKVLFCPGVDQPIDANSELAKVGTNQAQGSYFYRHNGNTGLFDPPGAGAPEHIRLDNLGTNRAGIPIRAIAIDSEYLCAPDLEIFGVKSHTHHRQKVVNILYSDGHVISRNNRNERFTVDARTQILQSFDKILQVFEKADFEQ